MKFVLSNKQFAIKRILMFLQVDLYLLFIKLVWIIRFLLPLFITKEIIMVKEKSSDIGSEFSVKINTVKEKIHQLLLPPNTLTSFLNYILSRYLYKIRKTTFAENYLNFYTIFHHYRTIIMKLFLQIYNW